MMTDELKLFISTNICQETVDDAIRHIMQSNRKPTILYVTSNGAVQKEEELADISEDALMSVLNGGGFNAVA